MEYRKLISFGKSSFVVSLPKFWITKQKLKKGDTLYLDEKDNNLILSSKEITEHSEEKTATLDVDNKSIPQLKREINAAYVENYKTIILMGKSLKEKTRDLQKVIKELIALEIVELNAEKIVAKDFLDIDSVSILELIRKIDVITRSMLEDTTKNFAEDNAENINLRDEDINRIHLLVFRAVRYGLKNQTKFFKKFNLDATDLLNLYWVTFHLEAVADETRRVARYMRLVNLKQPQQKRFEELLVKAQNLYLATLKAYYNQDVKKALELSNLKKEYILGADEFYKRNNAVKNLSYAVDRYKRMLSYIHEIGRMVYQH